METFSADINEVSVWELKGLHLVGFRRRLELCVVIHANVAQFLFDIRGGSEGASSLSEVLHEVLCKITASHVKDGVMQSATLVDGHCVDDVFIWEHVGLLLVRFRSRFEL